MINPWKVSSVILAGALATSLAVSATRTAQADQPHMMSAKAHLEAALHELNVADADKGGHRDIAIQRAGEALAQTQAGIDYARTH
jgi:hypothetical protein